MNDKELLALLHGKIHGLRMDSTFKPDRFTQEINILLAEHFEKNCIECRNKLKAFKLKEELKQIEPQKEKSKFSLGGLFK